MMAEGDIATPPSLCKRSLASNSATGRSNLSSFRTLPTGWTSSARWPVSASSSSTTSCYRTAGPWAAPISSACSRRSEEHTSELQSRLHLVCRLLLEKKENVRLDHWHHYIEAAVVTVETVGGGSLVIIACDHHVSDGRRADHVCYFSHAAASQMLFQ